MTAVHSVKSQVKNKGKRWVYFLKHDKKSATADVASQNQSQIKNRKAHPKKRMRKGKPSGNIKKADKSTQSINNKGNFTSASRRDVLTMIARNRKEEISSLDRDVKHTSIKQKQKDKKRKRKLKILKRKEREKTMISSENASWTGYQSEVGSGSMNEKSKKTSIPGHSGAPTKKQSSRMTLEDENPIISSHDNQGMNEKKLSRKRKTKGEQDTSETKMIRMKKKKMQQVVNDTVDSGMSSDHDEPFQLPDEPQDVASNWKVLANKLKASAPKSLKMKSKNKNKALVKKENEIWFDDVDPALLESEKGSSQHNETANVTDSQQSNKITKCIALDCEMVGVGHEGKESILARVSMVNEYGQCIYDKFVKPREKVTDFRTEFSGVRPKDLFKGDADEFMTVQKEVADIMKDRILVGHALKNDMKVLFLGHPRRLIRDTASYPHFRELMKTKRPALKKLAKTVLGVTVQEGEHNSVEDAQTAMRLYTLHRTAWEKSLKQRRKVTKK
ncbi:RNA exonuclease 4-like [Lytechinus variegatus]|uniref:RNA exonuclease 4-like n=1 Tax=Lytechinus variegatus TaxID=7654 RepID=UPI001BB195E6|nr:RNA exonuclease 4-like [Lytechinus variegatus]